ncbi:crotonase/enoyl-CoA hydratase family protein [Veronia pacifica]|uniref:Enoyl-CoA hydratase n=1 Tax=Veronia pacifica TaxID=1080227 RepID=A0A1C3EPP5_9GAMM|nr:crotonase/enoyl-CoA hydratase family protein [Veronia pacifica]ODA35220.1 enoyl-CoA hydratase [Veronia pacifica]
MEWNYLKWHIEDDVAFITFNRPDKYNALNMDAFHEIIKVQKILRKEKTLRAVILRGAGGNFCSGLDVLGVAKKPINIVKLLFKWLPGNANTAQQVSIGWQRLPVTVISVIEGICYGGGMNIALGSDMRFCSKDAKMAIMESRWGLIPDMAGLEMLRGVVNRDRAHELVLTSEVLDAEKAEKYGLVTQACDDPMKEAMALVDKIKNVSPDAAAAIKFTTHKSWSASVRSLLARETFYQLAMFFSKNQRVALSRQTKSPDRPYIKRQFWW